MTFVGHSSLLSRLTAGRRDSVALLVAENLVHVFNTRKGCGSALPEFGLGDYEAEPNTHAAVLVLVRELEAAVLRYEPRLDAPHVELSGRLGYRTIRFALTGCLGGAMQRYVVDIDTGTRQVDVRPEDA